MNYHSKDDPKDVCPICKGERNNDGIGFGVPNLNVGGWMYHSECWREQDEIRRKEHREEADKYERERAEREAITWTCYETEYEKDGKHIKKAELIAYQRNDDELIKDKYLKTAFQFMVINGGMTSFAVAPTYADTIRRKGLQVLNYTEVLRKMAEYNYKEVAKLFSDAYKAWSISEYGFNIIDIANAEGKINLEDEHWKS